MDCGSRALADTESVTFQAGRESCSSVDHRWIATFRRSSRWIQACLRSRRSCISARDSDLPRPRGHGVPKRYGMLSPTSSMCSRRPSSSSGGQYLKQLGDGCIALFADPDAADRLRACRTNRCKGTRHIPALRRTRRPRQVHTRGARRHALTSYICTSSASATGSHRPQQRRRRASRPRQRTSSSWTNYADMRCRARPRCLARSPSSAVSQRLAHTGSVGHPWTRQLPATARCGECAERQLWRWVAVAKISRVFTPARAGPTTLQCRGSRAMPRSCPRRLPHRRPRYAMRLACRGEASSRDVR